MSLETSPTVTWVRSKVAVAEGLLIAKLEGKLLMYCAGCVCSILTLVDAHPYSWCD